jgi:hypothetical protein
MNWTCARQLGKLRACAVMVELRGLETLSTNGVTCGNAAFQYAKRREMTRTTCGYTERVYAVNTVQLPP